MFASVEGELQARRACVTERDCYPAELNSRSAFGFRRSVCDEFAHGLKSSMRSNNGLAPHFGAFFGRSNGMVQLLVFFSPASRTSDELLVKLFFKKCR
jgi:hypothetical protein